MFFPNLINPTEQDDKTVSSLKQRRLQISTEIHYQNLSKHHCHIPGKVGREKRDILYSNAMKTNVICTGSRYLLPQMLEMTNSLE